MRRWFRWIESLLIAITLLAVAVDPLEAQGVRDDPEARALLEETRKLLVVWERFPGFKAKLEIDRDGKRSVGELTVLPSGKVAIDLQDREAAEMATRTMESIVNHRMKLDTHKHEEEAVTLGPQDQHPLGRLVKKADRASSTIRIKDQQILQVNQRLEKGWLSLNIFEYTQTPQGFLPKHATVFQFDEGGSLVKSTAFTDEYVEVGGFWLPKSRLLMVAHRGKIEVSTLQLKEHRLLPNKATATPAP